MSALLRSSVQPLMKTLARTNSVAYRQFWFKTTEQGKEIRFPKDLDHTTGEERLVEMAIAKGIKDPYDIEAQVRGPGTKDDPNIIQTFEESRLIACKCEEDSTTLKYMWVHLDEPKRCECGFWFKAVPARKFWEEVAGL